MAYVNNSSVEKSNHAGVIEESNKGFQGCCKCGLRAKIQDYRYNALSDLYEHFIAMKTLIVASDDGFMDTWEFLCKGMEGQNRNRHLLR